MRLLILGFDADPFNTKLTEEDLMDLSVPSTIDDKYLIDEGDNGRHLLVGEGRFSKVYSGHSLHTTDPMKVAIKVLAPYEDGNMEGENMSSRELFLEHLSHKNIIVVLHKKTHKVAKSVEKETETFNILQIIMEFCEDTLVSYIREKMPQMNVRIPLLLQLAQAIHYLHSNRMVHADLKPANILLKQYPKGIILKVTDLGLASRLPYSNSKFHERCGTKFWMPPEMCIDTTEGYGLEVDIFAVAHICAATIVCNIPGNQCNSQYCNLCRKLYLFDGMYSTNSFVESNI